MTRRRFQRGCWMLIVAINALSATTATRGEEITLPSVRDNTLYEDAAGAFSSGAGTGIFVGRVGLGGNSEIRRGLIRFNPADQIPAGSTITGATLRLYMNKTMVGAKPVSLHRTLADWGEGTSAGEGTGAPSTPGDATWAHRFFPTEFWSTAGGDFAAAATATTLVAGANFYEWTSPALTADVQAWLDNPGTNFGWTLIGDESASMTAKRFGSREWFFPTERPALIVTFNAPPPSCFADCDASGTLTIDDFICFQTLFAIGDPAADCDASGTLSIDDFICFQTLFALGC